MAARQRKLSKRGLSHDERVLWQDAVGNIRFLKQKQWHVTNYAALIYAAVIFFFNQCWFTGSKWVLIGAVAATALANVWMLALLQGSIEVKFRERVQKMYERSLPDWPEVTEPRSHARGVAYLLLAFSLVAAALVCLVVLTAVPKCT